MLNEILKILVMKMVFCFWETCAKCAPTSSMLFHLFANASLLRKNWTSWIRLRWNMVQRWRNSKINSFVIAVLFQHGKGTDPSNWSVSGGSVHQWASGCDLGKCDWASQLHIPLQQSWAWGRPNGEDSSWQSESHVETILSKWQQETSQVGITLCITCSLRLKAAASTLHDTLEQQLVCDGKYGKNPTCYAYVYVLRATWPVC